MAQFKANEADNYGGQGGGGFFSLKNDKDTALVRFMYNTIDDFCGNSVHEIEVGDRKRYINCLRAYNEPVNSCPLCASGNPVRAKAFIHVYDCDEQVVKIWDRGKTFIPKLSSLCARYSPLVSVPFEVERNGKKGDTNTTYETYPLAADDVTLDDLPEPLEILGSLVLDKDYDQLQNFIDTGYFGDEDEKDEPVRARRDVDAPVSRRRVPAASESAPSNRRTATAPTSTTTRRTMNSTQNGNGQDAPTRRMPPARNTDNF